MNPCLNLRHFAYSDVFAGVIGAQTTYFQYEVPFSLELCERMYQEQDNYGMQWLYGVPDQFIMLFAWINSLCESPENDNNLELVAWIETNLPQIKLRVDESSDPLLRIGRMMVQECWRQAVLIYLYMACILLYSVCLVADSDSTFQVLCKADAHDPRVISAQKGFMRLVRGLRPGRNPDFYLISPMVVVGAFN
jgi:hypothetical protein